MIKPTIHMNGTSADALFDSLAHASGALAAALRGLETTRPNARDYYPQGDAAFKQAQVEHAARVAHVLGVRQEIQALAEHVADERDAQANRR